MMTLCIGHLVIQSFKWTGAVEEFGIDLPAETAALVRELWPPNSLVLAWPPGMALDTEASLSNFASAFIQTGDPPQ